MTTLTDLGKGTLVSLPDSLFLRTTATKRDDKRTKSQEEKDKKKTKTESNIRPELRKKSGRRPEAIKTVFHVEPTNISELLNMNHIRLGPQRERRARKRKRKKTSHEKTTRKGGENAGFVALSIETQNCFSDISRTKISQCHVSHA